jgi:hypothetical protein
MASFVCVGWLEGDKGKKHVIMVLNFEKLLKIVHLSVAVHRSSDNFQTPPTSITDGWVTLYRQLFTRKPKTGIYHMKRAISPVGHTNGFSKNKYNVMTLIAM